MTKYGLIGAAGYVAKKHVEAIYGTGGELVMACDIAENVGWLDNFNKHCKYTKNFKELLSNREIETIVVCAPNAMHFQLAMSSLHSGKNVILEKPPCLHAYQLSQLIECEKNSGKWVSVLLQLRYNNKIQSLKIDHPAIGYMVYITPRGEWYWETWKGSEQYSGGIIFNIGIHMIDVLCSVFGPVVSFSIANQTSDEIFMTTYHKNKHKCKVFLSINPDRSVRRTFTIFDNKQTYKIDMTDKFQASHNDAYKEILKGNIVTLESCMDAIVSAEKIRAKIISCAYNNSVYDPNSYFGGVINKHEWV